MRLLSWNVNGIRATLGKGFLEFVAKAKPDILGLQETKAESHQVDWSCRITTMPFGTAP